MSQYESSIHLHNRNAILKILFFSNFYNWTMHYRKDADIIASYGFEFRLKGQQPPYGGVTKARSPNQEGLDM